jgi:phage baseplate assembly protein W
MAGIFPFMEVPAAQAVKKELPLFRDCAWNFTENSMELVNGAPVIVEGNEALKVWIYKTLRTARYRHLGYSPNYGSELEELIGSAYTSRATQVELERYVREALLINPYIKAVSQAAVSLEGDRLTGNVTVETIYGEVKIHV